MFNCFAEIGFSLGLLLLYWILRFRDSTISSPGQATRKLGVLVEKFSLVTFAMARVFPFICLLSCERRRCHEKLYPPPKCICRRFSSGRKGKGEDCCAKTIAQCKHVCCIGFCLSTYLVANAGWINKTEKRRGIKADALNIGRQETERYRTLATTKWRRKKCTSVNDGERTANQIKINSKQIDNKWSNRLKSYGGEEWVSEWASQNRSSNGSELVAWTKIRAIQEKPLTITNRQKKIAQWSIKCSVSGCCCCCFFVAISIFFLFLSLIQSLDVLFVMPFGCRKNIGNERWM